MIWVRLVHVTDFGKQMVSYKQLFVYITCVYKFCPYHFVRYHFGKKWYTEKLVFGQNGIRTKWYGQNGMDETSTDNIIYQSINPAPTDNTIFSSISLPL